MRVKPADLNAANDSRLTESGLASVVTSAPGARPNRSSTAASIRARSLDGSSVGVPPPTKTVLTGRSSPARTRRASVSSATTVPAYDDRLAPGPSSSEVYVLKSQ